MLTDTFKKCILVVDTITHAFMLFHNFQFYRSSLVHCISVFPPRPQAFIASRRSPATTLTYWYHTHTSHEELPILFLHGIGVGLYPYTKFLEELNRGRRDEDGKIGILAVEILPISSRITSPLLRKEEMCQQLQVILRHHAFGKFILVSHSWVCLLTNASRFTKVILRFGSVITTHLLKTPDLASQISSVVLVDPISILLHQPDVAYNFVRPQHSKFCRDDCPG